MGLLILDADTAVKGAYEGIELCMQTIIPSLFPFIFLSSIINHLWTGQELHGLSFLGKLCSIPKGCESVLFLGLIGGYPVGAKMIADTYQQGHIHKSAAVRLLGFCSNAGPAFIFGILSSQFTSKMTLFLIWAIHGISAILVGMILPKQKSSQAFLSSKTEGSVSIFLQNSLKTMASICGWVVLFRMIIRFLQKWFLWKLSVELQVLLTGIMELSNGCVSLYTIPKESVRFIITILLLSSGGICVLLQTLSVVKTLGLGWYLPGKTLQMCISFILALLLHPLFFSDTLPIFHIGVGCIGSFCIILWICIFIRKKL